MRKCINKEANTIKKYINKSLFIIAILCGILCSCKKNTRTKECAYFYPNDTGLYFEVSYHTDTILVKEVYKHQKVEYLSDTINYLGTETKETNWLFVKRNNEYYLVKDGAYELFMSNKIEYSDSTYQNHIGGLCHSIVIKRENDKLLESTYFFNVTESHRNPVIVLQYDKEYKIHKIKEGVIFRDYTIAPQK